MKELECLLIDFHTWLSWGGTCGVPQRAFKIEDT